MMKKLALTMSLIGILIIFITINLVEPKEKDSSEISTKNLGEQVKISGTISSIKVYKNNFTTFKLNNEIEVICNCENIKENQKIEVIGTISSYQNRLQIEAEKISVVI